MYGQGYDSASNMAGRIKGTQTVETYPKALYVHCAVDLAEEANITTMQYLHENIGEEFKKLFREAEVKIKTNVLPINYYMHLLF